MKELIDKKEILKVFDDREGFYDVAEELAREYCYYNMGDFLAFAGKIADSISNIIEAAEVIEERKTAHCIISSYMPGDYPIYSYCCSECGESVESNHADEEYKFCSYCGAKYEKISKYA